MRTICKLKPSAENEVKRFCKLKPSAKSSVYAFSYIANT